MGLYWQFSTNEQSNIQDVPKLFFLHKYVLLFLTILGSAILIQNTQRERIFLDSKFNFSSIFDCRSSSNFNNDVETCYSTVVSNFRRYEIESKCKQWTWFPKGNLMYVEMWLQPKQLWAKRWDLLQLWLQWILWWCKENITTKLLYIELKQMSESS